MPELRIPMDPTNPGMFYACCGLLELFDRSGAEPLASFVVDPRSPRHAVFVVEASQPLDINFMLNKLEGATCTAIAVSTKLKSIAPLRLTMDGDVLELDWWLDEFRQDKSPLKCWAGQQTSLSILLELLALLPKKCSSAPFGETAMTTSRFGLDPRSSWKAVDFGYSPNEQNRESATFALTEVLGAIGLQGFRPSGSRRIGFKYALWTKPLPRNVCRLAGMDGWEGLASSRFRFEVAMRGSYKFFEFAKGVNE